VITDVCIVYLSHHIMETELIIMRKFSFNVWHHVTHDMHVTALVRLRDSEQNSGGIEFRVSSEVGVSFDPGLIGERRLLAGNQFSLTLFHCSFCHSSFLRRQKRVILIY